jgi:hypothetical protein
VVFTSGVIDERRRLGAVPSQYDPCVCLVEPLAQARWRGVEPGVRGVGVGLAHCWALRNQARRPPLVVVVVGVGFSLVPPFPGPSCCGWVGGWWVGCLASG